MEWIASDNAAAAASGGGTSTWDRPIMAAVSARCEDFAACAATTIVRHSATGSSTGSRSGSHTAACGMYIFLDKVRWKYRHSSDPVPVLQKSLVVLVSIDTWLAACCVHM